MMKYLLFFLLTPLGAETIPIPASSLRGIPLGKFVSGEKITLTYKSGVWSRRPQNPRESPETTKWDQLRVVVFWENGLGERVCVDKDFVVRISGDYFIRMAEPRESGVGVVFYEMVRKK